MLRGGRLLAVLLTLSLLPVGSWTVQADGEEAPRPVLPPDPILDDAVEYLGSEMDDWGCIDGESRLTDWTVVAVAAAGHDPHEGSPSLVDGLKFCEPTATDTTAIARHILAIVAAGEDPRSFHFRDWVFDLRSRYDDGRFTSPSNPAGLNDDMFAILALRAAGAPASDEHVQGAAGFLLANQGPGGGWSYTVGQDAEPDTTAAALEALASARVLSDNPEARSGALGYLADRAGADADDCFSYYGSPNTDTTAWVILGLLAAKQDPRARPWTTGPGPWACLTENQVEDGGFSGAGRSGPDVYRTTQAVLALAGVPHGASSPQIQRPAATLSTSQQPVVDEPVDVLVDGAAFAGLRAPDGSLINATREPWIPAGTGEHTFEVLAVDADGVAALDTATFQVHATASGGGGSQGDDATGESGDSGPSYQGSRSGQPDDDTVPQVSLPSPLQAERNVTSEVAVEADPADARVVAYRVDWGDGQRSTWSATPNLTHRYDALGEHQIQAWAKDADGDVSEPAHATVEVVDAAPTLTLDGPDQTDRTTNVSITAQATDPDGPTPEVAWAWPGGNATGSTANVSLDEPGYQTVHATARDGAGNTAQASHGVLVLNRVPEILDVGPLTAEANTTHVLELEARDPDGDPVETAWHGPDRSAWGGQYHLATGGPGNVTIAVNVTDPYGAWVTANVTVEVAEVAEGTADDADGGGVEVTGQHAPGARSRSDQAGSEDPPDAPAVVILPDTVRGHKDVATLMDASARQPGGNVTAVEVVLGQPVPVRGTENFQALLPALPPGTYPVSARAGGQDETWGPWSNTTLIVDDVELDLDMGTDRSSPPGPDEPLDPASDPPPAPRTDDGDRRGTPLSSLPALLALGLAVAATRRRPSQG